MKKFFLMLFALMFTGSVFSAETYVTNATNYKVKVKIKFGGICDDEEFVLNSRSYKKFDKLCCLHHVKATGLEGPIASSATEEVGGAATGFGLSCGRDNRFIIKANGGTLILERKQ